MLELRSYEKEETKSLYFISTKDSILIVSTEIVELKFLKHGSPPSKNATTEKQRTAEGTATRRNSGTEADRNAPITADLRDINGVLQV